MDSKERIDQQARAEVTQTTGTPGWPHLKRMAEETIKQMERKAIDEEDEAKGAAYRREARAARLFWTSFLNKIASRQIEAVPQNDEWLEVAM